MTPKYEPPPPAKTPEFEAGMIDINFCHNPLCSNFGLSWHQSELMQNNKQSYKARTSSDCHTLVCTKCNKTMTLSNNQAVNSMFLWTVKNTLLHEYYPNKTCENYRVNLYENWDSLYGIDEKNPSLL